MSFLIDLTDIAVALVPVVAGWVILHHLHHLPAGTHTWLRRAVIVLMYMGGAALAVTVAGGWADDVIRWLARIGGGAAAALPYTAIVIACLILGATLVVGFIWAPDDAVAFMAIGVPVLLALPAGGLIHSAYVLVNFPMVHLAHGFNHMLGG